MVEGKRPTVRGSRQEKRRREAVYNGGSTRRDRDRVIIQQKNIRRRKADKYRHNRSYL